MKINKEEATEIILKTIKNISKSKIKVSSESSLIGGEALFDSMKLVELCVTLEDLAEKKGFIFDWTSSDAMSRSRSIFRNVKALAKEFSEQSDT